MENHNDQPRSILVSPEFAKSASYLVQSSSKSLDHTDLSASSTFSMDTKTQSTSPPMNNAQPCMDGRKYSKMRPSPKMLDSFMPSSLAMPSSYEAPKLWVDPRLMPESIPDSIRTKSDTSKSVSAGELGSPPSSKGKKKEKFHGRTYEPWMPKWTMPMTPTELAISRMKEKESKPKRSKLRVCMIVFGSILLVLLLVGVVTLLAFQPWTWGKSKTTKRITTSIISSTFTRSISTEMITSITTDTTTTMEGEVGPAEPTDE